MKRLFARSSADARLQDLLLRSLDGTLSPEEQKDLRAALETSPDARRELARLDRLREMVRGTARPSFGIAFTDRVMYRLATKAAESGLDSYVQNLVWSFRRVSVAAGIIALTVALYTFAATDGSPSLTSTLGLSSSARSATNAIEQMEIP